ncbi:MAG: SurA N-terminal domain-containing protein, partial [Proteobacteria bacterium]|nr:SurA N-terminal domain-containing protein [Pseudomonadota bacterium]
MPTKRKNIVVKIVTFALFGMLIASFAVWGIGDIFRTPAQIRAVAEVGEQPIHQQDYARALRREINRVGRRFGAQLEIDQARALGIPDLVLSQMIGRALFDQKAAGLDLLVTDAQVRRLVHREPAFQNSLGEFDRNRFDQQLRNMGMGEGEYIETLRRDITRQQIAGAVSEAVAAPRQLAEAMYRYREERRVARVLVIPNNSITDLPAPDPAALEAFHKEFSDRFMAPERRGVTLIQLRVADLAAEVAVSENRLREEFEARFEDLATPERRTIEQIVLDDEETARDAETRLNGGAGFATVARELTGADPVDLGALEKEDLPTELADAAFSIEVEAASAPLESPLGWHILRILKVEPAKEPIFADVRERLARDIAMGLAVESRDSIANQLDDELAAGATIEEAGRSLGLALRYIDAIDRQGKTPAGEPVEDLPPDRFLAVAFETEAGTESLLTESGGGDYFILRVDTVTPAQLRPLDQVREQVIELW